MDLRKVKKLIELLEASQLSELEITEGEESIRISRNGGAAAPAQYTAAPVAATPTAAAPAVEAGPTATATGHEVESPTVGTFYSRSSPDSEPFVKVGDDVKVGTTLCVVEAMKTFNEIQSDKAGKVLQILKSDGEPVEFSEALFVIG